MNLPELIRELNPAPSNAVTKLSAESSEDIFERSLAGSSRPRHRSGTHLAAIATGALCTALAVGFLVESPSARTNSAARALSRLARLAAFQTRTDVPAAGQYYYTQSDIGQISCGGDSGNSYCYRLDGQRQIWIGTDSSGRILETFGTPDFLTTGDQAAWISAGRPPIPANSDIAFGPNTLTDGPTNLADLPTQPSALAAALAAGNVEGGPPGGAEEFVQIGDILRETDASPALRTAAFQVLADLPGVTSLGSVTDSAGQQGLGFSFDEPQAVTEEYIFDPTTSALLAETQVADTGYSQGDVAVGTTVESATFLSSGVVTSLSSTPSGSVSPAPPVTCWAVTSPPSNGVPIPQPINSDTLPTRCG
jgi:hypothetical protein